MSSSPTLPGHVLSLDTENLTETVAMLKVLASEPRLAILRLLRDRVCNVGEIATALDLPASTAVLHIKALEETGLLKTELRPAVRGLQKVCARNYDSVLLNLIDGLAPAEQAVEVSMPVGAFVDCQVVPTCGMISENGIIGTFDDPASFYEPDRMHAQLIWFRQGYVEYRFPNRLPPKAVLDTLQLSMEICSEAPLHHDDWPSDITLWINGIQVGTWTSPRDFGGERGALTPAWWENFNSQYGLLKVWQVNVRESLVDGVRVSDVRLSELELGGHEFVAVRLGVRPDAQNVGGLNIFGRHFGNYPQDIVLRLRYHYEPNEA
jgi:predicted transcriptional regulator